MKNIVCAFIILPSFFIMTGCGGAEDSAATATASIEKSGLLKKKPVANLVVEVGGSNQTLHLTIENEP